jgi:hypothetical protein
LLFHARARLADCKRGYGENRSVGRRVVSLLSGGVRIVACPRGECEYVYELRQGEEVVATGRLSRAQPFEVGERVSIGGREGIVRAIKPLLGELELRLVVQLVRAGE